MAIASSNDHLAAKRDTDLMTRTFALAESDPDFSMPQSWVEQNWGRIISAPITEDGHTMVKGHAYAVATYEPTPLPGANLAAVTDDQIRDAIAVVRNREVESAADGEPDGGGI